MEVRFELANAFEKETVKKLNFILSSIFYSYEEFKKIGEKEMCEYLERGFLTTILNDLDNVHCLEDYYKCLTYLCEAAKFESIKLELVKSEFFMEKLWAKHLTRYY
jgi:hypothetical protein